MGIYSAVGDLNLTDKQKQFVTAVALGGGGVISVASKENALHYVTQYAVRKGLEGQLHSMPDKAVEIMATLPKEILPKKFVADPVGFRAERVQAHKPLPQPPRTPAELRKVARLVALTPEEIQTKISPWPNKAGFYVKLRMPGWPVIAVWRYRRRDGTETWDALCTKNGHGRREYSYLHDDPAQAVAGLLAKLATMQPWKEMRWYW